MVQVGVTFLLYNLAISGSCTYQVLTRPRIASLLFHMSVFYWHTCYVAVGSRVTSSLDHVSYFIGPHGRFLFDHVSQRCPSMFCIFIRPRGLTTSFHMSDFNSPRVESYLLHVSCTSSSMCCIFIWSCGLSWFYRMEYNQFVIEVIRDRHYGIDWLHDYLAWQSNKNN
jgi:hypothetical protein